MYVTIQATLEVEILVDVKDRTETDSLHDIKVAAIEVAKDNIKNRLHNKFLKEPHIHQATVRF